MHLGFSVRITFNQVFKFKSQCKSLNVCIHLKKKKKSSVSIFCLSVALVPSIDIIWNNTVLLIPVNTNVAMVTDCGFVKGFRMLMVIIVPQFYILAQHTCFQVCG